MLLLLVMAIKKEEVDYTYLRTFTPSLVTYVFRVQLLRLLFTVFVPFFYIYFDRYITLINKIMRGNACTNLVILCHYDKSYMNVPVRLLPLTYKHINTNWIQKRSKRDLTVSQ